MLPCGDREPAVASQRVTKSLPGSKSNCLPLASGATVHPSGSGNRIAPIVRLSSTPSMALEKASLVTCHLVRSSHLSAMLPDLSMMTKTVRGPVLTGMVRPLSGPTTAGASTEDAASDSLVAASSGPSPASPPSGIAARRLRMHARE